MPLFSIIVPVYQVEDYLAECLDSLLTQDLWKGAQPDVQPVSQLGAQREPGAREPQPDSQPGAQSDTLEIICVNDGSTDGSRAILAEYAQHHSIIRIIDQENSGLAATRNAGMQAARGDYLIFVDSDDFLAANTCSKLKAAFEQSDADIITFGGALYPENTNLPHLLATLSPRKVVYEGFSWDLMFKENSHPYIRCALKHEFVKRADLSFDTTLRYGEDEAFYFLAYAQAKRIQLLPDRLYIYRALRPGSETSEKIHVDTVRINAHLAVIESVMAGWSALGILQNNLSELLEWALEYCTYDIATQASADQAELLHDLGEILAAHLDGSRLEQLKLMRPSKAILRLALQAFAGSFAQAASSGKGDPPQEGSKRISAILLLRWRLARKLKRL